MIKFYDKSKTEIAILVMYDENIALKLTQQYKS